MSLGGDQLLFREDSSGTVLTGWCRKDSTSGSGSRFGMNLLHRVPYLREETRLSTEFEDGDC